MKHVGFTGTQLGMTEAQGTTVLNELRKLRGDVLHHGDCVGADAQAHDIARHLGLPVVVHPPIDNSKRAHVSDLGVGGAIRPPQPYLVRNRAIVDEVDVLIAAPKAAEELRSGTWSTVRYARRHSKPVIVVMPDGTVGGR